MCMDIISMKPIWMEFMYEILVWNLYQISHCLSCVGKILIEMLLVGIRLVLWFILSFI